MKRFTDRLLRLFSIPLFMAPLVLPLYPARADDAPDWTSSAEPGWTESFVRHEQGLQYIKTGYKPYCTNKTYLTRGFTEALPLLSQIASYCAYDSPIGEIQNNANPYLSVDGRYAGKILGFNQGLRNLLPTPGSVMLETHNNGSVVRYHHNPSVYSGLNSIGVQSHELISSHTYDVQKHTGAAEPVNVKLSDIGDINYSKNGDWATITLNKPNKNVFGGIARMNMQTNEIITFSESLQGSGVFERAHISNSGQYAVTTLNAVNTVIGGGYRLRVYDLQSCQDTTARQYINNSLANCAVRDYTNYIKSRIPGIVEFGAAEFVDEYTISFYATTQPYQSGVARTYRRYLMRAPGAGEKPRTYLAMGDSFASGEGLFEYFAGTDNGEVNNCHLAPESYPYLIGRQLMMGSGNFHSVACSGATTQNVSEVAQYSNSATGGDLSIWFPGLQAQNDYLKNSSPDVITLSIGGNDIGFGDIVARCAGVSETCYSNHEDRVEIRNLVANKFESLVVLYEKLLSKSEDSTLYIVGYPKIFKEGKETCELNASSMSPEEIIFANRLVEVLNDTIESATKRAGGVYIDIEDVFGEYTLCGGARQKAVNGLTTGDDKWGVIGNEGFHPTELGHRLIANEILAQSQDFYRTANPDTSITGPTGVHNEDFLANTPTVGRKVYQTNYSAEMTSAVLYKYADDSVQINEFVGSSDINKSIKPGSEVVLELHSTPIVLGTAIANVIGSVSMIVSIPDSVPTGFHTLHLFATAIDGTRLDFYKTVYVAESEHDMDGNGVDDSNQPCGVLPASGVDYDQDDIDDACDPVIGEPAVISPEAPTIPTDQSDSNSDGVLEDKRDTSKLAGLVKGTKSDGGPLSINPQIGSGLVDEEAWTDDRVAVKEDAQTGSSKEAEDQNDQNTLLYLLVVTLMAGLVYAWRYGKAEAKKS